MLPKKINNPPPSLSPFSTILVFTAFILIGLSLIPVLDIQLSPSRSANNLAVSYGWPNASARLIEQEVTSTLEGLFSSIKGLEDINSVTRNGTGSIQLSFKKNVNLDAIRFEIATLVRQVYHQFPPGVSYPQLSLGASGKIQQPVFTLTLNGSASPHLIRKYAEDNLVPKLSVLPGVNQVNVSQVSPFEWEIAFDYEIARALKITPGEIRQAIEGYFRKDYIGVFQHHSRPGNRTSVSNHGQDLQLGLYFTVRTNQQQIQWGQIPVKNVNGRIIHLSDLAKVRFVEQPPSRYDRINGLNTINLTIFAADGVNQVRLASTLREQFQQLNQTLPPGYQLITAYDATVFIEDELQKIGYRTLFSSLILLVFVLLVSRQFRYLLLVLISLVANLVIAAIFYYLFQVEIHLYSLAGITVSFGIIIDNTIVMVDHYRHQKNLKVFLAILAATLTTIGALSVIFFLEESQRLNLIDFAAVVMINLGVSVLIALFFIPALMEKIRLRKPKSARVIRSKRRVIWFTRKYERMLLGLAKVRWLVLLVMILGFGLPVHLLPEKIEKEEEEEGLIAEWYNQTLGSDWYRNTLKPWSDKILGGTLRLFAENVFEGGYYQREPERTQLFVRGNMPEGCTVQQLNEAFVKMESFISTHEEIKSFQTTISSAQNGRIVIDFKEEHEFSSFPYYLKDAITSKAISLGGMDWSVTGVGRGFSNSLNTGYMSSRIRLLGYNYEALYAYAEKFGKMLLENPRIQEIEIAGDNGWRARTDHEFYLEFDQQRVAQHNLGLRELYQQLNQKVYAEPLPPVFLQGEAQPVKLVTANREEQEVWHFSNHPLPQFRVNQTQQKEESSFLRLKDLATVEKRKTGNDIHKMNQQYQLLLKYNFIGPGELGRMVEERFIEQVKPTLPLGYSVDEGGSYRWRQKDKSQYYLIFLVVAIIFFICSVLLESLRQPLAIVALIPFSFIGIFLTFFLFEFRFDQGGYASFILLSGITVNSGLYIVNDFNNLRKRWPGKTSLQLYLKAFNQKIIPVLLTILSTILGLIPFVWQGQQDAFWFALAAGAIGGLVFSLFCIVVVLPLLVVKNDFNKA